jgi:hypothetical protein
MNHLSLIQVAQIFLNYAKINLRSVVKRKISARKRRIVKIIKMKLHQSLKNLPPILNPISQKDLRMKEKDVAAKDVLNVVLLAPVAKHVAAKNAVISQEQVSSVLLAVATNLLVNVPILINLLLIRKRNVVIL